MGAIYNAIDGLDTLAMAFDARTFCRLDHAVRAKTPARDTSARTRLIAIHGPTRISPSQAHTSGARSSISR